MFRTGVIPNGFLPKDVSPFVRLPCSLPDCVPLEFHTTLTIYTDGSGHMITGCLRAGYGIFDPNGIILQVAAPLLGREQPVQKAELMAAAHALAISPNILHLFIDNLYVLRASREFSMGLPTLMPTNLFGMPSVP